mgnify:CR=1 FL=1
MAVKYEQTIDFDSMSIENLEKLLSQKEKRFVAELEIDGNGTQAAIRAGCTPGKNNQSAAVAASRMLRSDKVLAYRRARAREVYKSLGLSPETVATKLMDIFNRCMQKKAVMEWDSESRSWQPSGEWRFDSRGALKALELMGQSLGMFKQKIVAETRGLTLEEYIRKLDNGADDGPSESS